MVGERNDVIADRNSQIDDARQNLNQVLIEKEKLSYELEMLKKQVIANKPAENIQVVDSPQTIPQRVADQHEEQHVKEHVQHIEPEKKEVPILEAAPLN